MSKRGEVKRTKRGSEGETRPAEARGRRGGVIEPARTTVGGAGNLAAQVIVHGLGNRPGNRFCGARADDDKVREESISEMGAVDRIVEYNAALEELAMVTEAVRVGLASLGLAGLDVRACGRCELNMQSGLQAAKRVVHGPGEPGVVTRGDDDGYDDE